MTSRNVMGIISLLMPVEGINLQKKRDWVGCLVLRYRVSYQIQVFMAFVRHNEYRKIAMTEMSILTR